MRHEAENHEDDEAGEQTRAAVHTREDDAVPASETQNTSYNGYRYYQILYDVT